jgi:hypothetical protein
MVIIGSGHSHLISETLESGLAERGDVMFQTLTRSQQRQTSRHPLHLANYHAIIKKQFLGLLWVKVKLIGTQMAVRLLALRTGRTLLPRNGIFMLLVLVSVTD